MVNVSALQAAQNGCHAQKEAKILLLSAKNRTFAQIKQTTQ
jgi:hypothetical protein